MSPWTCQPARHPILMWLVRGGVGVALLVLAASSRDLPIAALAVLAALLALGGCPMCWTLGLIERVRLKFSFSKQKGAS